MASPSSPHDDPRYQFFPARWRSVMGGLTLALLAGAGICAVTAVGWPGRAIAPWAVAATFAAFAWLLGKPLFRGIPVLRVGPRGVSGYVLNNRTVPWVELKEVRVTTVQGHATLQLTLAPGAPSLRKTRRLLTGRGLVRHVPLSGLPRAQQAGAAEAVRAAFAQYAAPQAHAALQAEREEIEAVARFHARLAEATPTPWALYAVVAANVAVWVWNVASGLSPFAPRAADLFRWGANSAWAVTREGEAWRLAAAMFLHGGLLHLAMNMLGLWQAGKLLNRLLGNGPFLLLYAAAGLAGSALSLHFTAQASVSVGASGAVFGVLGALLVTMWRHREALPTALGRSMATSQGVFLLYALVQGFAQTGVDNAAHIGGLLAGVALGTLLRDCLNVEGGDAPLRVAASGVLACAAVAGLVLATPAPPVDHRAGFAAEAVVMRAMPTLQAAQGALAQDAQRLGAGQLDARGMADRVEQVHLPAYVRVQGELAQAKLPPTDPRAQRVTDVRQMTAKSIELLQLQVRAARGEVEEAAAGRDLARLSAELGAISQRLKAQTAKAAGSKPR